MTDRGSELDLNLAGWIPLRLAVVAPLAGANPARPDGPIRVRAGALEAAMKAVSPSLLLHLAPPIQPSAGSGPVEPVEVQIAFSSLKDFTPRSLIMRLPVLRELAERRLAEPAHAAELDRQLSGWLDAVLHHPAFLELESAWRGLDYLATRGAAGDGAEAPLLLDVLAVAANEDILPRFRRHLFEPDYEDRSEFPLAAVVWDRTVDPQAGSIERLSELAGLLNAIQSVLFASAGPSFFGMKSLAHLPALPDLATRTQGGAYAAWSLFQKENAARWVSLTVNPLLMRAPYADDFDLALLFNPSSAHRSPVFRYQESVDPAHPEWMCWGNAGWAAAVSLAASYAEHGHCAAADGLSGSGGHLGLPTRALTVTGRSVQIPTEILLADEKAWELCRAGFTPLVGQKDGDTAYFPFLGNVYRPRPGSITIDQALTYQLYAGQFGHVVLRLLPGVRGLSPEEAAERLQAGLFAHFSPFVGDRPGERVQVETIPLPDGGGALHIKVSPTFRIQEKPIELELQVPLG